jgi:hypothetical protein
MSSHQPTSSSEGGEMPQDAPTKTVKFLQNLKIPTFEDSIWSTEGLRNQEDMFNAAMYLLSSQQFSQPLGQQNSFTLVF